jgi:hypothetical protein
MPRFNNDRDRYELVHEDRVYAWIDRRAAEYAAVTVNGRSELARGGYEWVIEIAQTGAARVCANLMAKEEEEGR